MSMPSAENETMNQCDLSLFFPTGYLKSDSSRQNSSHSHTQKETTSGSSFKHYESSSQSNLKLHDTNSTSFMKISTSSDTP